MINNELKVAIKVFKGEELVGEDSGVFNSDMLDLKEGGYLLPMSINEVGEKLASKIIQGRQQKK